MQLYEEKKDLHKDALYAMNVLNVEGKISEEEWEIINLYCAIVFEKVEDDDDNENDTKSDVVADVKKKEEEVVDNAGINNEATEEVLDSKEIMKRQQAAAAALLRGNSSLPSLSSEGEKKTMSMSTAMRLVKAEMGKRWDDLDKSNKMKIIQNRMDQG